MYMCGCGTDGILCLMQLSFHQLLLENSNFVFINHSFPAYHLLLIIKLCRISGWIGMLHHVKMYMSGHYPIVRWDQVLVHMENWLMIGTRLGLRMGALHIQLGQRLSLTSGFWTISTTTFISGIDVNACKIEQFFLSSVIFCFPIFC